jgi:CheY-like chemotaxis protein
MLSDSFTVVGRMTDGRQAIDEAATLQPDVIVLDVDMPGLDGFQTLQLLQQGSAAAAPVVFLSVHQSDDTILEAFRRGGKGYVLKSRAARDLTTALDQVLLGRLFVPSLEALSGMAPRGVHAMQLHAGSKLFLDSLADFFHHALRRGDATCAAVTQPVRDALNERLRARGWDTAGHPRYLVTDASEGQRQMMRNGVPDAGALAEIVDGLNDYRATRAESETRRLTFFGMLAVPLSEQGNLAAVLDVERTWNTLTGGLPFLTICGYNTACFHDDVPGLWPSVCAEHVVVGHAHDV